MTTFYLYFFQENFVLSACRTAIVYLPASGCASHVI